MMKDFKSFNENSENEYSKFLAIAENVYSDLHDIVIKEPSIKYCVYLIKSKSLEGKTFYCVNVVMTNYSDKFAKDLISLRDEYYDYYKEDKFVFDYCMDSKIKVYTNDDEILGHFGDNFVSDKIDTKYLNDVKDSLLNLTGSLNKLRLTKSPKHSKVDIDRLLPKDFKFKSIEEFCNSEWIKELTNNIDKYIDEL